MAVSWDLCQKTHIPNYNEFYEQRQFAGAEEEDVEFVDFLKGVKNEKDEFWDEIPFWNRADL